MSEKDLGDKGKQELTQIRQEITGATPCTYLKLQYLGQELAARGKSTGGPVQLAKQWQHLANSRKMLAAPAAAPESPAVQLIQGYGLSQADAEKLWTSVQQRASQPSNHP